MEIEHKVLVIFQRDEGRTFVDRAITHIKSHPGFKPVEISDGVIFFDQLILHKFNECVYECDSAIAILRNDDRKASEAGNLWLEIGIWYAIKKPDSLLLCVEDENAKLPSDINGVLWRGFKEPKDLEGPISRFLSDRSGKHISTKHEMDNLNNYKVLHTITNRNGLDCESMFNCKEHGKDCHYRREFIYFISELLRMGRSNFELATIKDCLYRFSKLINIIINTYYEDEKYAIPIRERHIKDCKTVIKLIVSISDKLLIRKDCNHQKIIEDSWDRVGNYLTFRLKAAKNHPDLNLDEDEYLDLKDRLNDFILWCKKYSDSKFNPKFLRNNFVPGATKNEEIESLYSIADFAQQMAYYLEKLGNDYFYECRETINSGFTAMNNVDLIPSNLSSIREGLPHNLFSNKFPPIWPDKF